jgi:hypothetical protein
MSPTFAFVDSVVESDAPVLELQPPRDIATRS